MEGFMLAILGGSLAALLAGIGSAIGCSIAGQSASGVITEDPGKFGTLLPLVALPGTQGFYGFVGMFLIINKIAGVDTGSITSAQGLQMLFAALPVGLVGMISAIYQGLVCASACSLVAKRPGEVGKGITYGVIVETYAVLGLLVTIILLGKINLG
ncbi:MAG: permease [Elusimicrobia bacterium CG1_02_37_114]|nr:MAG: permease [Elusimicrobia bacterium CG1_02_37_114]PIV53648.1 MAG: permease [Elusimicrobia bacterium CG02_land_8_20_14_3_00_37_13]PIZ13465.1 MAG: permease [Elusimicrobia bacterium CG_4_10_14_0_8_um_filter_37_32]